MEQLSAGQQDKIRKSSTERLRHNLASEADGDEEVVQSMDRPQMMEAVAHQTVMKQKVIEPMMSRDWDKELQFKQIEVRLKEMDMEKGRMAMEKEMEKEKMMLEKERMKTDLEREKMRMEYDIRMREPTGSARGAENADAEAPHRDVRVPRWEDTLAGQTKRYGDMLRHVLPCMPTEVGEIPQYFETVENLYILFMMFPPNSKPSY